MLRAGRGAAAWSAVVEHGAQTNNRWHTAIEVAHGRRLLETTGWRGAEWVFRGIAHMACAMAAGEKGLPTAPSYERNLTLVESLTGELPAGPSDSGATVELFTELRSADHVAAADTIVAMLRDGVSPNSLWDALALAAAELTLRRLGSAAIHAVTSNNALHFSYGMLADDRLKRLMLLRAASYLTLSRDEGIAANGDSPGTAWHIGTLTPAGAGGETPADIFAIAEDDPTDAVRVALGYLDAGGDREAFLRSQAEMTLARALDAHRVKFPVALIEEAELAAPPWQHVLLACTMSYSQLASAEILDDHEAALSALGRLTE
jgi:hypothetical protein